MYLVDNFQLEKYLVGNFESTLLGIKWIQVMRMPLKHTKLPTFSPKVADLSPSFSP